MKIRNLIILLAIVTLANCGGNLFLSNNRGLDYKIQGKKDEHRFGVDLEENKQFHHTITDADGVRLGCYGYELDGKKFSTNYIADGKGYRLAPKNGDIITVFAKDTLEPRKASFIGSFESEVKSGNIRYLFPEGCESPMVHFDPLTREETRKKFIAELQREALENQRVQNLERRAKSRENKFKFSTFAPEISSPTHLKTISSTTVIPETSEKFITEPITTTDDDYLIENPENVQRTLSNETNLEEENNKYEIKNCCFKDRMNLIFPPNDDDFCPYGKMAQFVIPIPAEKLSAIPMKELLNLSSIKNITTMIKKMLEIVEKFDL